MPLHVPVANIDNFGVWMVFYNIRNRVQKHVRPFLACNSSDKKCNRVINPDTVFLLHILPRINKAVELVGPYTIMYYSYFVLWHSVNPLGLVLHKLGANYNPFSHIGAVPFYTLNCIRCSIMEVIAISAKLVRVQRPNYFFASRIFDFAYGIHNVPIMAVNYVKRA